MLHRDPEPIAFPFVSAGILIVREGLPHPGFEKSVFDIEIRRPDVLKIAGWPFYAEPLKVRADTLVGLELLAANPASFTEWTGEKRCGGFHPDYALTWPQSPRDAHILLCFGCSEALLVATGVPRRVNLGFEATFASELQGYRNHRPLRRGTG